MRASVGDAGFVSVKGNVRSTIRQPAPCFAKPKGAGGKERVPVLIGYYGVGVTHTAEIDGSFTAFGAWGVYDRMNTT